jgi:DNA-binding NarL/FixJ family response regulator
MITILLVDDQPAVRQGLRMRLAIEPDVAIVGEAGDAATALNLLSTLGPDVVVMDIEMPGMNGITATAAMRAISPHTAVVVLTMHDDAGNRRAAFSAGAAAFVGKHAASDALPAAIRQAAASYTRAECIERRVGEHP